MLVGNEPEPSFAATSGLHGTTLVVRASGELDHYHTPILRAEMNRAWAALQSQTLILDLSALTFCDSSGIGELLQARHQGQVRGVRFILTGIQGNLARRLNLAGLTQVFEVFPSVAEALEAA
ncbi:STAS domain-containing protein [Streptosporangium sp. NBC_01756]|uniref:STAS domain-containing protein n=1 Tax=Streptosporangium sp. NBC_01756 TaxID=2975950 RepID=UPI002DD96DC2|nr:STAS domain-containing protein [Streptosporangium sp. NBC_01756]WSC88412.1 STAS domain-containing protein [Streptosporangium sp. NBC_01756]